MKKKRIIPVVLFKDGYVVQSRGFSDHRRLGLLGETLKRLEDWNADEIVILNISSPNSEIEIRGRTDLETHFDGNFLSSLMEHSKKCSVPLTVGGGLRSFDKASELFAVGADKVLVNSSLHISPNLIGDLVEAFGSQAVVLGVDVRRAQDVPEVWYNSANTKSNRSLFEVVRDGINRGAGELFINSIDRDGRKNGLDLEVLNFIGQPSIPVTLCGGVGNGEHIASALSYGQLDGVAAANFFHHIENALPVARLAAIKKGMLVRKVSE